MEELCRWKKSEQDVSYAWGERWTAQSSLPPLTDALAGFPAVQRHESCFACAAFACKGPFKVGGFQTRQGDHPLVLGRLSI